MNREIKTMLYDIQTRKSAILIGAAVGFFAASYLTNQGIGLNEIANAGKGLIDSIFTRSAPLEMAQYKLYGLFMFFGAAVGYTLDWAMDYFHIGRRRR